jgi:AmmeMemoRadiSam system protein B
LNLRPAAVAGSWYPGRGEDIVREVDGYLSAAQIAPPAGRLVALVSPHAGLRYSGPVAAYGYSLLRGLRDTTCVLVGPSHRVAFEGCAIQTEGGFETPLGVVPIGEPLARRLLDREAGIGSSSDVHRAEHSLEMQLPFLQHLIPGLRIVPILMGTQERSEVDALADALKEALVERPALLVASSDLSHYQPAVIANALDAQVVAELERLDADALMTRLEHDPGHACGGGPIVAVMRAARALGANQARVLRYGDSGDVGEKDKSRVVGYLSAALTATSPA